MIAYHTDENYIFSEPMSNRTESQMLKAYEKIIVRMKTEGLGTKKHVLDNYISKEYKSAIKENGATHKLVPPGEHRRNIAKKYIPLIKKNVVGVLDGLHGSFPTHIWC